jgi:hypothetical protein
MPANTLSAEDGSASRFPFITLERAIDRARELRKSAGDHAAPIAELPAIWKYAKNSSGWKQTVSALKYYGLITDSGTKDRRAVRLTDDARRYFLDERPEVQEDFLRQFALAPRAFSTLWKEWKAAPPAADNVARTTLKLKFGYAENAAPEVLRIYKDNLAFAKLVDARNDSPVPPSAADSEGDSDLPLPPPEPPAPTVKVGSYVQWTSDGQEQFDIPRRITWLSDDGTHARVFGSMTGIPTADLAVREPPPGAPPASVHSERKPLAQLAERPDINVLLTAAGRLEITADVDGEGLKTLKAMLDKYEEILKLLAPIHSLNQG